MLEIRNGICLNPLIYFSLPMNLNKDEQGKEFEIDERLQVIYITYVLLSNVLGGFRKIKLYPTGKGEGWGTHLSLYLALADPKKLPPGSKIYADFTLRILNQVNAQLYYYGKGK